LGGEVRQQFDLFIGERPDLLAEDDDNTNGLIFRGFRPLWVSHGTYEALNNDALVLAAIGLRTVFDRASEKMGVDPALQFDKKLDALEGMEKIGRSERETLEILTDAGGAAAHRGWKPTVKQLDTLMTVGEQFLSVTGHMRELVAYYAGRDPMTGRAPVRPVSCNYRLAAAAGGFDRVGNTINDRDALLR
jgi:uncharacterized protein DUF4145